MADQPPFQTDRSKPSWAYCNDPCLDHECPSCQAAPGWPCLSRVDGHRMFHFHRARIALTYDRSAA